MPGTARPATPHRLPLALLGGVVALWAGLLLATLAAGGADDARSGTLMAVFRPGLDMGEVVARVAGADGTVVGATWLGNVWHVRGERAGFAGALRARGAFWVLPTLPVELFGMGGCGFGAASPFIARES